jgi:hypothetical protein
MFNARGNWYHMVVNISCYLFVHKIYEPIYILME